MHVYKDMYMYMYVYVYMYDRYTYYKIFQVDSTCLMDWVIKRGSKWKKCQREHISTIKPTVGLVSNQVTYFDLFVSISIYLDLCSI